MDLSIHFPIKVKNNLCSNQDNSWIEDFSREIESDDYSIVLEFKYRELYQQIHQYKNT